MTALPPKSDVKLGLVIDLDTCVGCHACVVSCKGWNTENYGAPLSDQDAYDAAFQLIRERQFEPALSAMESFVQTYPDSELVLDARFWRGQVFDVLGRDQEAIEAFKSLTLVAPDYRRILQVKVKLGKLLIRNQDVMNGRKILQEVITQAPESVEAGLASRELEKVN